MLQFAFVILIIIYLIYMYRTYRVSIINNVESYKKISITDIENSEDNMYNQDDYINYPTKSLQSQLYTTSYESLVPNRKTRFKHNRPDSAAPDESEMVDGHELSLVPHQEYDPITIEYEAPKRLKVPDAEELVGGSHQYKRVSSIYAEYIPNIHSDFVNVQAPRPIASDPYEI